MAAAIGSRAIAFWLIGESKRLYGLRIKKLYQDGKDKIFVARVSDKIRILWVETIGMAVFTILGNQGEIKNYIRRI